MSTKTNEALQNEFRDELYSLYKKTCDDVYYSATFWVALGKGNWLKYIKNFIGNSTSDGIEKLIKAKRPDLSFEYVIVNNEKFYTLFDENEIEACKATLEYMDSCINDMKN